MVGNIMGFSCVTGFRQPSVIDILCPVTVDCAVRGHCHGAGYCTSLYQFIP